MTDCVFLSAQFGRSSTAVSNVVDRAGPQVAFYCGPATTPEQN